MFARQQTSRLVHEVQQSITSYQPTRAGIDRDLLADFAKAVLGSVDVRDLRGLGSAELLPQLEAMLATIAVRKRDEIKVSLHYQDATDTLVVETCVARGVKAGLFRTITLWPFPIDALAPLLPGAERIVMVEASHGQLEDELRLAVSRAGLPLPRVESVQHYGGVLPQQKEIVERVLAGLPVREREGVVA